MKNLILLNRSGMNPEVTCRKGRHAIESIVSRFSLASLICLCMLTIGSGNVWGAVGGALKTYDTNSSTFTTGYKRQSGDNFIWWGQKNYYGANNATNHGKNKPTAADLPVVKAHNSSATTSTTGLYYCYTSEAVSNVGAVQITFSAKSGSSTVNAYVVSSSTAASSGSATWTKLTLLTGSPSAQGANVCNSGTYTFTFPKETSAKYYGVVFVTSSYWRATGFQMKLLEGCTAPTAVAKGTLTSSSFGLTITDAQNAGNYDIYFSTSSTAPTADLAAGSFSTVNTKTPTVSSGVSASTTYYVWARSSKTVSSVVYKSAWVALTGNTLTTPSAGTSVSLSKAATTNGSFKLSSSNTGTPEIKSVSTAGASGTVYVVGTPSTGYYVSNVTQSGASAAPTITEVSENVWSVVYGSSTTGTSTITVTFSPIWALKGDFDSWGDGYVMTGTGTVSVTRTLTANTRYEFKIYNKATAYGNNGAIVHSISDWTFATDKNNCVLYTGPAGDYTFSINTSTKATSVTYPSVTHPNANYVYIKKGAGWSDARIYNYQSGSDSKMSDWGGSPILASCEICDETYYYGAAYFNKIIFRDGGSNQSNEVSLDRGKWLDETSHADSWSTFDKYTISYDKGTGTGGSMSSHTDLCPGSNQALSANAFTKDHYHFTGWIADRDVTINSATVTQGTLITGTPTIENIQHDIELTAQWEADSYSVTATLTNVTPSSAFPSTVTYTGSTTTALNSTFTVDATNFFLPSSIAVTMGGTPLTQGTDYTYNNSTGAFAVSKVITGNIVITATAVPKLKSIAITTQPTTRKYLVGDVFSSTGAVVTATMGDGNTKTVSATWTPSSALSAGTGQTVTASYTENGINQTATTTIDVYSVTVNKVNMSGKAITNASVTATCSGRTLSQSVGSTNYKFNSWNVTAGGVSLSGSNITGTPTGNVTINAKFHDPITVTWKVGSGAASGGTGEVKYGTAITALPSTPADNALASCGTNKFMGWTALGELKGTGNDAPADLFTTVGGAANLTTNTTYRAVFANQTGGGASVNTVMYSETFEGYSASDVPSGSVSTSSTNRVVYNSGSVTYTCVNGSSNTKIYTDNLAAGDGVTELLVGKSGGSFTVAGIPSGGAATLTVTYKTNAKSMTVSTTGTGYSGSCTASTKEEHSFDVTVGSVSTFTLTFTPGSDNVRLDDIKVKVKTAGTTTSDYQTGCCSAPGTALSITSANSVATGGTVSLTSTGGNGGTVTWSVVNGTGSATITDGVLTAGSIGTVTVKAHQDANTVSGTEYCAQDAEQAFTVVSSTINVTGVEVSPTTKAIVPGETFTITPTVLPANATDKSVSWTSSASGKASVSSGTVTGVAEGTATITCTTTDGSYTATCAVTVRDVTLQARDEDGNTIAAGGPGAPSRSGATITAAANAGNYVFKQWQVTNASVASTTTTPTTISNPTGAVTVTAVYYKPRVVKWSVNGNDSYNTGSPTTTVAYNGTISTVPDDPDGLACASTFVAWTDAAHNNGQTAKDDDSYYESKLFTDAGDFPNITADTTTFYAVFAEGGGAAVNTVMWSEDWTGATSSSGSGTPSPSDARPSAQGDHSGKTVYGGATITYTDGTGTYVRTNENNAGGTAPELLIKANENWTISGIPTGGAATLTLEYRTNGTLTVSTSTDNVSIGTKSGSNPYTNTITVGSGVTSFNLSFTQTSNRRIDNVSVKVASVSLTNYVTECDANIVKVTYDANGGATSCTNTTTDKTEDFTVCGTEPTRDYYTFAGWQCSADDEVYDADATILAAAIDADFSLTAQWTPVTYTITYELDGGTNHVSNPASYNVETSTITLQNPTKGHDRFDGWYDNGSFTGDAITSIPLGSHGNVTLYAKWAERHHIEFFKEGVRVGEIWRADDENMEDAVAGQGSVPSDPSAPTTCSSKVFVGWTEEPIDDETDDEPADLMKPAAGTVDEDKEFHAVWATEESSLGPVTVFNDAFEQVTNGTAYGNKGKISSSNTFGTGTAGEARISSSSNAGYIDIDLSDQTLESTFTIAFKLKYWSNTESGTLMLGCEDEGSTASFSPSSVTYPTTSGWHDFSCTVTNVNAATQSVHFQSYSAKRVYIKDIVITQTSTVYTHTAYSTSCCATKVTLSKNSPEHGTIVFDKATVPTCGGDKEVSLTITPAAGYQLSSYEVATGSGKVAAKSVSPAIALNNNSSAAQNITLTFAEDANGAYDVTAAFSLMTVTSWTWTMHDGGGAIPDPLNLYVGQSARLDVAYTPAGVDASKKTYERTKEDAYINWVGARQATYSTISGKASTGENTTPVTFTHADGPSTTVNVKVLPLPLTHFADLVHGKAFADVAATIEDNALSATKNTPISDDWVTPNANTCEENHLHMVGWIREDWPALVNYLNGTGDAPSTAAIIGAGNDGSGHAYFFTPGASINTQTFNGVTFYAVWSKVE